MAGLPECGLFAPLSSLILIHLCRTLVKRAIAISKQFETSSRARERQMRANESLPLTSQADAAFLVRLAELGISDKCDKVRPVY